MPLPLHAPPGRLDKAHPDRKGEQLRKWAPVFKAFAKHAEEEYGGKVGVFIDYTALPQRSLASHAPGAEDDRTPEELATFKRAPAGCNRAAGPVAPIAPRRLASVRTATHAWSL